MFAPPWPTLLADMDVDADLDLVSSGSFSDPEYPDGYAYLYRNDPLDQPPFRADVEMLGGFEDQAGQDLASGDIDGDGSDDILVGAPGADGPDDTRTNAEEPGVMANSDRDGDGRTDTLDCLPDDPSSIGIGSTGFQSYFDEDRQTFVWAVVAGAESYEFYRGTATGTTAPPTPLPAVNRWAAAVAVGRETRREPAPKLGAESETC